MPTRRAFLALAAAAAATGARARGAEDVVEQRTVKKLGRALPCVGLGTWQTFDVGGSASERTPLAEVLRLFVEKGGAVVDSSPMYGRAETVLGDLAAETALAPKLFVATKVWTSGTEAGAKQIEASFRKLRVTTLDLLQIHNLLDWRAHLPTLRALKKEGRVKAIGVTHWQLSALDDLERIVRTEDVDFVQLPYSVITRDVEKRLLPAAKDLGVGVLVMRPFEEGALFGAVKGKALPAWAAQVGATSWAQLFLKFVLSHEAVTAPIPATSKPKHLVDNMGAGRGPFLDAAQRAELVRLVGG